MYQSYEPGEVVEHVLNKEWVLVLEVNNNIIRCRTKDFQIIDFNDFEIRKKK